MIGCVVAIFLSNDRLCSSNRFKVMIGCVVAIVLSNDRLCSSNLFK